MQVVRTSRQRVGEAGRELKKLDSGQERLDYEQERLDYGQEWFDYEQE